MTTPASVTSTAAPSTETSTAALLDPEEVAGSVTGFDEIAIARAFGQELTDLSELKSLRALAFVLARRRGLDDTAAYNEVMGQSLNEVMALFDFGSDEPQSLDDVVAAVEGKA